MVNENGYKKEGDKQSPPSKTEKLKVDKKKVEKSIKEKKDEKAEIPPIVPKKARPKKKKVLPAKEQWERKPICVERIYDLQDMKKSGWDISAYLSKTKLGRLYSNGRTSL